MKTRYFDFSLGFFSFPGLLEIFPSKFLNLDFWFDQILIIIFSIITGIIVSILSKLLWKLFQKKFNKLL